MILREATTYSEGSQTGKYGLPGGRIEANESFFDALAREVKEETGLTIKSLRPLHIGEWWPVISRTKNHIVAMFVLCASKTNKVVLSEEHDEYQWVDKDTYQKFNIVQPDVVAVKLAIDSLTK